MTLTRYADYKDSGVEWLGELPAHWALKPLWTLFRRVKRTGHDSEELLSVYRDYGVVLKSSREDNFNKPSDDLGAYQLVVPGDLVINKMKAWQGSVAVSEHRGIVSPAYFVYEALHNANGRYLHYLMRSVRYITGYLSVSKGIRVAQWDLEPQLHSRMPLAVPPLSEQAAIAAFLDHETAKIDKLVAEQRRLLELLKEKRQAVVSHGVTRGVNPDAPMKPSGVEWLGDVPAHWTMTRVKSLAHVISKGTTPTTIGAAFTDDGVRFIKAENITETGIVASPEFYISEETHATLSRSALRDGDVLVVIAGATTGKSAVFRATLAPANTNQAVSFVRPKDTRSADYIALWLSTAAVRDLILQTSVQSAQPNLSMEDLGNIIMPLPPDGELRAILAKVADTLVRFDALTAEAQRAIDLLQERRTALISAAVTGQIDVRGVGESSAS